MECIVFSAKGGLANRLRALAGYHALAEFHNVPLYVHWPVDAPCSASLTSLFELSDWANVRSVSDSEFAMLKQGNQNCIFEDGRHFMEIWMQDGKMIPQGDFVRRVVGLLQGLRPTKKIQHKIDSFLAHHNSSCFIGLHIRWTDNIHNYDLWRRTSWNFDVRNVSTLEGFRMHIQKLLSCDRKVFLATDNPRIARELRAQFANVVMYEKQFDTRGSDLHINLRYRRRYDPRRLVRRLLVALKPNVPNSWRTTNIEDALVDLIVLSRCEEIIGTYHSSFGECASLIGGKPLSVMLGDKPQSMPNYEY